MKRLISAIIIAAMLALPCAAFGAAVDGSTGGGSVLGFQTADLYGNPVDDSILGGAVITVFNFWATWCGPCVNELPLFNMMYNNYNNTPEADVQLVGVVADPSDYAAALEFVQQHNYNWLEVKRCDILMDQLQVDVSGGVMIPQTLVVDYRGDVLACQVGSVSTYNELYHLVNDKYAYVMAHYPPPAVTFGDADGNGLVNANDALAILRMSLGLIPMGDPAAADVDGSGQINATDALMVLRAALGIITL